MVKLRSLLFCLFIFTSFFNLFGSQQEQQISNYQFLRNSVDIQNKINVSPNTILLSYRRSGTHMIMYIISYLTKRPCGDSRFDLITNANHDLPRVFQVHNLNQTKSWYEINLNPAEDYLLLIVRNYKECMMREFLDDYEKVVRHLQDPSEDIESLRYFENLENFDRWDPERRLLVYFEDVISDPKRECQRLLGFLNQSDEYLENFIHDVDAHFAASLDFYAANEGGTFSRCEDANSSNVTYHTELLPEGIEEEMDRIVLEKYPELCFKYLSRYLK